MCKYTFFFILMFTNIITEKNCLFLENYEKRQKKKIIFSKRYNN